MIIMMALHCVGTSLCYDVILHKYDNFSLYARGANQEIILKKRGGGRKEGGGRRKNQLGGGDTNVDTRTQRLYIRNKFSFLLLFLLCFINLCWNPYKPLFLML